MRQTTRIAWVDLAKAASIVLVVLYHSRHATYVVEWRGVDVTATWSLIGVALQPFRMPLFFLISGLLAAGALKRSWAEAGRARTQRLVLTYLLWAVLFAIVLPPFPEVGLSPTWPNPIHLLLGQSLVWYLWALAVFFSLVWVTRGMSRSLILAATASIAFAGLFFPAMGYATDNMLRCFVFFVVGARYQSEIISLAETANGPRLAIWLMITPAVMILSWSLGQTINPVLDLVATITALFCAALTVRRLPSLVEVIRPLTARTLQIYVLHFPLILGGMALAAHLPDALLGSATFAAAFPLVLAISAVTTAFLIARFTELIGWDAFLFGGRPVLPPRANTCSASLSAQ